LLRIRKEALTGSPGQQLTSAQALVVKHLEQQCSRSNRNQAKEMLIMLHPPSLVLGLVQKWMKRLTANMVVYQPDKHREI
jgi:hypothetical protein